jgi:hypothetical protein
MRVALVVLVLAAAVLGVTTALRYKPLEAGSVAGAPGSADVEILHTPAGWSEIDVPYDTDNGVVVLTSIRNDGRVPIKVTGVELDEEQEALDQIAEVRFIDDPSRPTDLGEQHKFGTISLSRSEEVTLALHLRISDSCHASGATVFDRVRVTYTVGGILHRKQWVDLRTPVAVVGPENGTCP